MRPSRAINRELGQRVGRRGIHHLFPNTDPSAFMTAIVRVSLLGPLTDEVQATLAPNPSPIRERMLHLACAWSSARQQLLHPIEERSAHQRPVGSRERLTRFLKPYGASVEGVAQHVGDVRVRQMLAQPINQSLLG